MKRYHIHAFLTLLICTSLLVLSGSIAQPAVQAQTDNYCFPETNQCISGNIRAYWEQNGGLSVFGYPVTDVRIEKLGEWSGATQWFERDRLEDHGIQGVMAGRLGAYLLQLQDRSWHTFETVTQASQGCVYFAETKHSLCEPFLSYWQQHGSLERFGYPITEPFFETINGQWSGTVQYFERRRMELHPELPGTPILLGLLGNEVLDLLANPTPDDTTEPTDPVSCDISIHTSLQAAYDEAAFADTLGCPTGEATTRTDAAIQKMQEGIMLWIDNRASRSASSLYKDKYIFAVIIPEPTFSSYVDTWDADDDDYILDESAPSGYYPPRGGFGKVWDDDLNLRYEIGWAVEREENETTATVQDFEGGIIIRLNDTGTVFVFGEPDATEDVLVFD